MNPNPLHFKMSDRLVFGNGAISQLPELVEQLDRRRPLIVTDRGLVQSGVCARIVDLLTDIGKEPVVFDQVQPDPPIEIVEACLEIAKQAESDVLIGLGGGSSLDIAKVTAVLLTNGGVPADYFGIGNVPERGVTTVMIPTTAGTGSEVTPIAILSDKDEQLKKGIVSDHLYPDVALVDPELCKSVPPHVTAYTGMDALTHAIEAYTNKHAQPFVDTFALEAIRLIGQYLRRAVADGSGSSARYHMSLASLYGGLCLGSVNTAAVHALAYPLGGTFDVPHGVANSLLLPYVLRFNAQANPDKHATIAAALGKKIGGLSSADAAAQAAIAAEQLAVDIGITRQMRQLEIPRDAIPEMATGALKVTRLLNNNPREVTRSDAIDIYEAAY